jgi:nitroreductase
MSTTTDGAHGARVVGHAAAMAEAARWAPSVHNSQPWRFALLPDGLAVRSDAQRGLPVLDPLGRLRTISCGAAVLNASVALAARGVTPRVRLLPDPNDPTLLATVVAGPPRRPGRHDLADAAAVPVRRTHRRVHAAEQVPAVLLDELARAVAAERARLTVADATARRRLAGLLVRAVRAQSGSTEFTGEVESWIRHWGTAGEAVDGIPVGSLGTAPYPVDSLVQEVTDADALRETELAQYLASATVVAVSTPGDGTRDWLVAGMALERMLLRATSAGLVATFADQATQQPDTRRELAEALDLLGHPQIVVRLGRPLVDVPPTPRRPIEEMLV